MPIKHFNRLFAKSFSFTRKFFGIVPSAGGATPVVVFEAGSTKDYNILDWDDIGVSGVDFTPTYGHVNTSGGVTARFQSKEFGTVVSASANSKYLRAYSPTTSRQYWPMEMVDSTNENGIYVYTFDTGGSNSFRVMTKKNSVNDILYTEITGGANFPVISANDTMDVSVTALGSAVHFDIVLKDSVGTIKKTLSLDGSNFPSEANLSFCLRGYNVEFNMYDIIQYGVPQA